MYDFHLHTDYSEDGSVPMSQMIEAAIAKGLTEIALTDHYDPDYRDPDWTFWLDEPAYQEEMVLRQEEYRGRILVRSGLEIGIQKQALEESRRAVRQYPYDFIIGSFHCACGWAVDLPNFYEGRTPENADRAFYEDMLICLKQYRDYDVIGHFNLIDRYAPVQADPSCCRDLTDEILRQIVSDGKGLEINTSCFRRDMNGITTPTPEILKEYVRLGGEIITIGSDAHVTQDVGEGFLRAEQMILAAGLDQVATFERRKPIFHKIMI